jgi:hypothetical protein
MSATRFGFRHKKNSDAIDNRLAVLPIPTDTGSHACSSNAHGEPAQPQAQVFRSSIVHKRAPENDPALSSKRT